MNNFTFQNPVKLIFGEGEISKLDNLIDKKSRIMVTYGGGSIHKNGIYEQVISALNGCDIIEFGGIEPNPEYATLMKAITICKEQNVDMILAVGGGSVLDGTKFIAAGAKYDGDPWDFMGGQPKQKSVVVAAAIPFGTVLTLPATGSEMNCGGVISRRERKEKFAFFSDFVYPQFSILDPTVIYSLPQRQIANGIVDTYIHTIEQYLTVNNNSILIDRWAESILQTLIDIAPKLMSNNKEYDICANFMLSATMALNNLLSMGTVADWATHLIGHELTALHGLDHAVTLAIVQPGIMNIMREAKREKLLQYAERVWGIVDGTAQERIDKVIIKTEEFYRSVGMKTRLSDHEISDVTIDEIKNRFNKRNLNLGENGIVTPEKIGEILLSVK